MTLPLARACRSVVISWRASSGIQAASFATSSRVTLDSTLPLRTSPTGKSTTTLEVAPHSILPALEQQTSQPSPPSTRTPSSFDIGSRPAPQRSPIFTPRPSSQIQSQSRDNLLLPEASATVAPTLRTKRTNQPLRFSPQQQALTSQPGVYSHTLHASISKNNTILSFVDDQGAVLPTLTAGTNKEYRGWQRKSHEAADLVTRKMMEAIGDYTRDMATNGRKLRIRLCLKGVYGQGREAVVAAIGGPGGSDVRDMVCKIEDRTRVKIGGNRAKKAKRL